MKGFKKVKTKNAAIDKIINVNYQCIQFVNGLLIKYEETLDTEEKESLSNMEQHFINLNDSLSKLK